MLIDIKNSDLESDIKHSQSMCEKAETQKKCETIIAELQLSNSLSIIDTCHGNGSKADFCSISMFTFRDNNNDKQILLSSTNNSVSTEIFVAEQNVEIIHSLYGLMMKTKLFVGLLCYIYLNIAFMSYREMNPIFQAQALYFNSQYIGYSQAWSGLTLLVFTLLLQNRILKIFQYRKITFFSAICGILCSIFMPSIYFITKLPPSATIAHEKWFLLLFTFLDEGIIVCYTSILFVCAMCFLNNSVPNAHIGKANGLAHSLGNLAKAISPTITGFIWSESYLLISEHNHHFAIYFAYLPAMISFFILAVHIYIFVEKDMQYTYEKRQLMNQSIMFLEKEKSQDEITI